LQLKTVVQKIGTASSRTTLYTSMFATSCFARFGACLELQACGS
jgi:hypothetical protein